MSVAGLIIILAAVAGGFSVLLALSEIWLLGSSPEPDVGPWQGPRPAPPPPATVPHELRTLGWGEQAGWYEPEQWNLLCTRLIEIEVELGGRPGAQPPPPIYNPDWLEQRLRQLEQLAGPLPAPWTEPKPTPRKWWKIL